MTQDQSALGYTTCRGHWVTVKDDLLGIFVRNLDTFIAEDVDKVARDS